MEVTTIVGIVIAIIIMIIGLRMVFKKPKPLEPSLDSALHIDPQSHQPVIPRHVRDQLAFEAKDGERKEPVLHDIPEILEGEEQVVKSTAPNNDSNTVVTRPIDAVVESKETKEPQVNPPVTESILAKETDNETMHINSVHADSVSVNSVQANDVAIQTGTSEPTAHIKQSQSDAFELNSHLESAAIAEFEGESSILDVHLHEQQRFDDESALATAKEIVALYVYPNPRKALSGDKTLKILLKYGLRYGEMACFHRHENTDEPSALMFSVLRITDAGPAGFDLEALSTEQIYGLAFFLALPHQDALKGFDMMASIAGLIAREVDGKMFDENNLEFTPQLKEHWRHHVIDYRLEHGSA